MKMKLLLLVLLLVGANGFSQYTNIPDNNFEAKLISMGIDDVADGKVLTSKISNVSSLFIPSSSISDLTGIQDFTKLTSLTCYGNTIINLDLSKNTALSKLQCQSNNITSLDLSKNTALTELYCGRNNLSSLNLKNGKNSLLKTLDFSQNYSLSCITVDDVVFSNSNWDDKKISSAFYTTFECSEVTQIPDIEFENKLIALGIDTDGQNGVILSSSINNVKTLDVSNSSISNLNGIQGFTALNSLNTSNNLLKSIDLSQNSSLTTLNCSDNASLTCIQVADIAFATNNWTIAKDALANFSLDCRAYTLIPDPKFEAQLIALKFDDIADGKVLTSKINNIKTLSVSDNSITDLTGIQDFTALTDLRCDNNKITKLDLSKNTALTILSCNRNLLTSLDLSKNIALKGLQCTQNNINTLDISKNTALTQLICYHNKITSLDVSKNTALTYLDCFANKISSLDISKNTAITYFSCSHNELTKLNLKNGKNTLFTGLSFNYNPDLSCVVVDDVAYSNTNWTDHTETSVLFSPYDCSTVTSIPDALFENKLIALGIDTDGKNGIVLNSSIATVTSLNVDNSSLTDLTGLEGFTALKSLSVSGNLLNSIDLSKNVVTTLDCSNNANLTCIQVADIDFATSNWTIKKDELANLSLDCKAYTLIPDAKFEAELIKLKIDDIADGKVQTSKINTLKSLYVSYSNINDLTGIEDFTSLKSLECNGNNLTSLDVSKNVALSSLNCSSNGLTNLDLTTNTALTSLDCSLNALTSLDVSQNTALSSIYCSNNKLTTVDLSKLALISYVDFNRNKLKTLDVSNNTQLYRLYCTNNIIEKLDLSKNTALTGLYLTSNKLVSLNLKNGKNTQLNNLDLSQNPVLSCITVDDIAYSNTNWADKKDVKAYFTTYDCSTTTAVPNGIFEDKLIALGIDTDGKNGYVLTSSIKDLPALDISNSSLTDVTGLEGFAALKTLNVSNNSLSNLDLSKNGAITTLNCSKNVTLTCIMVADVNAAKKWTTIKDATANFNLDCRQYTVIPDTNFEAKLISLAIDDIADGKVLTSNINTLKVLNIENSSISDLTGIQDFAALTNLSCGGNQLTSLDVSKNTLLENLNAGSNELTQLNVNTGLKDLSCGFNQITILDLSKNTELKSFYCYYNKLTSLNLKNGKNTLLTSALFYGNPDLSCIQVDDVAYANTNWTKDSSSFYTTNDCATITVLPDPLFEDKLIALGIDNDGKNGFVFNSSIKTLVTLNVSNSSINNLTGIQGFSALTTLECDNNKLKKLDISKNKILTTLSCAQNQLTELDTSENTSLTKLTISSNQISNLDLTKNVSLVSLISDSNELSSLDLSKNTALSELSCKNNDLYSLDLSQNTSLSVLNCSSNSLTDLDVQKNTKLTTLICSNNKLSSLDVSNTIALTLLDFSTNQLQNTDLSKNIALTELFCISNELTALDVSKNKVLTNLNCSSNQLTSLNLKNGNNNNFNSSGIHFENNPNLSCIKVDNKTYSDTNWSTVKDASATYNTSCGVNLPSDNFTVQTKGESCAGENNGEINITALQAFDYTATINGQSKTFVDKTLHVAALTPGNYTVSITIPDEDFEQIFTITIPKATTVTGKSNVSSRKVNIEITDGTAPYTILVDGVEQFQTDDSSFSLTADAGSLLEVKTAKACEGVYKENITGLALIVSAYPNPTSGSFEILLPAAQKEAVIELISLDGRIISNKKYNIESGAAQLTLENQPNGVYVAKIYLDSVKNVKIIKK